MPHFATNALARTGDVWGVQKVLGHSDERSTRRYAQLGDRKLLEVVGGQTVH